MAADRLEKILIDNIIIGAQQVRSDTLDEDIEELAIDIERNGLRSPIRVYQIRPGSYQLEFGSRRIAAHRHLRKTMIEAIVSDTPPDHIKGAAVRENVHRKQMTMREECAAVKLLHDEDRRSINELAAIFGKGRAWVQTRLLIPTLPPEIADAVLAKRITIGIAEILITVTDAGVQAQALQHCMNERWTPALLTQALHDLAANTGDPEAVKAGIAVAQSQNAAIVLTCACHACGAKRAFADLINIKVCAAGCEQIPAAKPNRKKA